MQFKEQLIKTLKDINIQAFKNIKLWQVGIL
jgi:hypothetical protein